jgi:trans-AT polyketide synthase/acyltransferase/oxidoreductase domain-containing protein
MTQVTQIPLASERSAKVTAAGISSALGWWTGNRSAISKNDAEIHDAICNLSQPVYVLQHENQKHVVTDQGLAVIGREPETDSLPLVGFSPASSPRQLGDTSFCKDHGLRFPYMCGSMANGIASIDLVEAAANAGLLGSFGAAGLTLNEIEDAAAHLTKSLSLKPFCFNLIFSPNEKGHENAVVSLYLKYGIRLIETSAYMELTLPAVRYRVHGIHQNQTGEIETPNRIIAKASRVEVATKWLSPPPKKMLTQLIASGDITEEQAVLAARIPVAQDLTVEADSGGHTDNRPAITLLPTIIALRDRLQKEFSYATPLRVGAAGGIATPASAVAAFSMGAAYIVTGTVNQACIESGSSDIVRKMLAEAEQADVTMAPAVDMFEMGVKLQVLKRGTMFAMRGNKLYEIYRAYDSIDAIPEKEKQSLEKTIFRASFTEIWNLTQQFFNERDPQQIAKADQNAKYKMALIFRWYLGLSSRWANSGDKTRQVDYQVWCGPSMGAFNEWTRGSWLAKPAKRNVVTVALNILYGAAVATRINSLRNQGVNFSCQMTHFEPLEARIIEERIQ